LRPSPDLVPVGVTEAFPFPFASGVTVPVDTEGGISERMWEGREDIGFELDCCGSACGRCLGSTLTFGMVLAIGCLFEVFEEVVEPTVEVEAMFGLDSLNSGRRWSSLLSNLGW